MHNELLLYTILNICLCLSVRRVWTSSWQTWGRPEEGPHRARDDGREIQTTRVQQLYHRGRSRSFVCWIPFVGIPFVTRLRIWIERKVCICIKKPQLFHVNFYLYRFVLLLLPVFVKLWTDNDKYSVDYGVPEKHFFC